jgi:hypothetical protein
MSEDRNRSVGPGQWAPWITDPDPDEEPMTPEEMKRAAEGVAKLMLDPNRKEPVDPFRQPLYPPPARSLEEALQGMRNHRIKVLMRDYPAMTRERAAELVALDLPVRAAPPVPKPRHMMTPEEENEDLLNSILRNNPLLTRDEAQWWIDWGC